MWYSLLTAIRALIAQYTRQPQRILPPDPIIIPPMPDITPPQPVPTVPTYLWDTYEEARHSARVIMDEEGLTYATMLVDGRVYKTKDVICACIEVESHFQNYIKFDRINGPIIHQNKSIMTRAVLSTDWGICQINDKYHIGPGKDFPSVDYVMQYPDHAVRFMVRMTKAGKLNLWVSFSAGIFKQYLPVNN